MSLSQIPRKTERRRHPRTPMALTVSILCEGEDGAEKRYQARLMDASVSGVKLWLPARLPLRTLVSFNSPDLGLGGRGTVRYCNASRGGYTVGLEVSNGTGWSERRTGLRNLAVAIEGDHSNRHQSETVDATYPHN